MAILSEAQGITFLCSYGFLMIFVTWLAQRKEKITAELYLVANRNVSLIYNAFAIAASWIWAPALLVSSEMAYTKGIAGAFWFCVPNIIAVGIFAVGAYRLRQLLPRGYTMPEFIRVRFDARTHKVYLAANLALQVCTAAVQIVGGASVISWLTGLPFLYIAILLPLFPLIYTLRTGLKASIITDVFQMLMVLAGLLLVPWAIHVAGGWSVVQQAWGGASGQYTNIFNKEVIYSFGIITTVGLLSGLFGDQKFWQRSFACGSKEVARSYLLAALIFGICPVSLSLLGFIAANPQYHDWVIPKNQLAGVVAIQNLLPLWSSYIFLTLLVSCLMSSFDAALCAASSLVSVDIYRQYFNPDPTSQQVVMLSRITLCVVTVLAVMIALIPGLQVLHLFLFYGTLRVATFIPTLLALFWKKTNRTGVFWGVLVAIGIGMPIFGYGSVRNSVDIKLAAFFIVLMASTGFSVFFSLIKPENFDYRLIPPKSKALAD